MNLKTLEEQLESKEFKAIATKYPIVSTILIHGYLEGYRAAARDLQEKAAAMEKESDCLTDLLYGSLKEELKRRKKELHT